MAIAFLKQTFQKNRAIINNAGSIFSTYGLTSIVGALFWRVAGHSFTPSELGVGSAAISSMTLLASASMLGLGTLLVGEIRRTPERSPSLISTALLLSGAIALLAGGSFAALIPVITKELAEFSTSPATILLFAVGVMLTANLQIMDLVFLGMLRSQLQLARNSIFAIAKLALLQLAVWLSLAEGGLMIYVAWGLGNLVSILPLPFIARIKARPISDYAPRVGYLKELGKNALLHHLLNLSLMTPQLALPVIVTALFSAKTNASFYLAWLVANFLFIVPVSLTYALYAVSAGDPALLADKTRFTLRTSFGLVACGFVAFLVVADLMLGFFGPSFAEMGAPVLRILAIGAFPLIIRAHYVAISQVHSDLRSPAPLMALAAALEIGLAALGGTLFGLNGVAIGWVTAFFAELAITAPVVYRTLTLTTPLPETWKLQI